MAPENFPLMATQRQVLLRKDSEGWWIARVPSLPGCVSQGPTKDQALQNIKDAIHGYIEALEQDGLDIPPADVYETAMVRA